VHLVTHPNVVESYLYAVLHPVDRHLFTNTRVSVPAGLTRYGVAVLQAATPVAAVPCLQVHFVLQILWPVPPVVNPLDAKTAS